VLSFINGAVTGNASTDGGGLYFDSVVLSLTNVTLSGNSSLQDGGAIYAFNSNGTLTNVTISGNSSPCAGGGIANYSGGPISSTNLTLSGNSAGDPGTPGCNKGGGGIYNASSGGTLTRKNTIVANSPSGGNCYVRPGSVSITSSGFNLSSDDTCAPYLNQPSDQKPASGQTLDAMLGPLANNGGSIPYQTHLPRPGSPAIDHGTTAPNPSGTIAGCPGTDQRGLTRPVGAACDVGSVEVQAGELATPTPTSTTTPTPTVTPTATVTPTRPDN
jgi:predicted outer membrane repeat protein